MRTIHIRASREYDVIVEPGALARCGEYISQVLPTGTAAIITDDTVASLYLEEVCRSLEESGFSSCVYVFPHGEDSKSHATLLGVYDFLLEHQITRTDFIVALGGGVVGDLAGYAAATYLRGIPFVQLPTTFLAAIDSSVGGKTAVNLPAGKNLVGAFYQPWLVLCDTQTFRTLPPHIFADGAAEMVKYGLIRSPELLRMVEAGEVAGQMEEVVLRCVSIKQQLVEQDERDRGPRMLLNYGHTLGHAIEKLTNHQVSHGCAVAMGMVLINQLGERLGINGPEVTRRTVRCLERCGLPTRFDGEMSQLAQLCRSDKKREGGCIHLVFVPQAGQAVARPMPVEELERLLSREVAQ